MPIIILGLLVTAGIVIYAIVQYRQSEDVDTRTVRERYPHVFEKFDQMKKGASYTVVDDDEDEDIDNSESGESADHTMHFPDDAEVEKRKRNIH